VKKIKLKGEKAFNDFYESIYGSRWDSLKEAFEKDPDYMTLSEGLLSPYYMDSASVYPVRALDIAPGQRILDMCAAPGGKTLLIALALAQASGKGSREAEDGIMSGTITANDRSPDRRNRLIKVLDELLPPRLRESVTVTGHDASRWGIYEKNVYDRVLLDAPCSSERHVYLSKTHLGNWSPARTRQLSERQFAMLAASLDAVKPGGKIVYSTCSISPAENDGIIEKLLKKRAGLFEISGQTSEDDSANEGAADNTGSGVSPERTACGFQIMPDKTGGSGPIYYTIIKKL